MTTITVPTRERSQMVEITDEVRRVVAESGITHGQVVVYVPHTTAAVTINEAYDPDVARDLLYKLTKEIPQSDGYHHAEGNSDAHLKASLFGSNQTILIDHGSLVLGRWQGIFFCEFDGPRQRNCFIAVTSFA